MRNLGTQAEPGAAHACLPQLVPNQTNPKPSGHDQKPRVVLLQHPRGFPFTSRRIDHWWRLFPSTRSGTELCCIAAEAHPIGAYIEIGIPLRTGAASVQGRVTRVRQRGAAWETALSLAPGAVGRAVLLARICALESRLHGAQPRVRVREARRRAEDWQRLLRRLAAMPALYVAVLSARGRLAGGAWLPDALSAAGVPPRPRGVHPR